MAALLVWSDATIHRQAIDKETQGQNSDVFIQILQQQQQSNLPNVVSVSTES